MNVSPYISRRTCLRHIAFASMTGIAASKQLHAQESGEKGLVIGEPAAEKVGAGILESGGNAIDAIVAAAFASAVTAPRQNGIGGYGASAMLAVDGGKKLLALDANSTAPAAMTADLFQPVGGKVPGAKNEYGWLAAGVPGILAGLELIHRRFGTVPLGELMKPAIQIAREGFPWPAEMASLIQKRSRQFGGDPGSRRLYFRDGQPLAAGEVFRNPELAEMLEALAKANSVSAFYRGDIALRIAEAFARNGGMVTAQDLAAYEAILVEPYSMTCGNRTIHTAPLTAAGLTVLQAMKIMQAMRWQDQPEGLARTHARVESLRLAWRDRLTLLGDPDFVKVPVEKLLSDDYARESAGKITAAVKAGKIIPYEIGPAEQNGTINLCAMDRQGRFVALTLTHGNGFGAQVTVDGLGLTLGHGMSRFDPDPKHPNCPGPRKRPLHNMTPTIVTREGKAIVAIGGRGGRRIPNAIFEVLTRFVVEGKSLIESIEAPRMHTIGTTDLELESSWPGEEKKALASLGYKTKNMEKVILSAVTVKNGRMKKAMR